jgi:hypothetical protein
MTRHLLWALVCVGCASAPPAEPKVVERVVYVEAPCRAPVMVEHHGKRGKPKPGYRRHPHGKHSVGYAKKRMGRCDRKPNAEARERCRRIARAKDRRY